MTKFRNRNQGVRKVKASTLKPHPKNHRVHGIEQQNALSAILERIGFYGSLIAVEREDGLLLIDGHLRADLAANSEVDVQVVDLSDEEVAFALASHDMVGGMAEVDQAKLDSLLQEFEVSSGELAAMFSDAMKHFRLETLPDGTVKPVDGAAKPEAKYPLVPVFNERYDYVIVFSENETEWGALQTIFDLRKERSYKSTAVGVGRVVKATRFIELWNKHHGIAADLPVAPESETVDDAESSPA